jgi:hypothetical protein
VIRRHGVTALLTAIALMWGAGISQMEDGRVPPLDRPAVITTLASEAGSSATAERIRASATPSAKRSHPMISV